MGIVKESMNGSAIISLEYSLKLLRGVPVERAIKAIEERIKELENEDQD